MRLAFHLEIAEYLPQLDPDRVGMSEASPQPWRICLVRPEQCLSPTGGILLRGPESTGLSLAFSNFTASSKHSTAGPNSIKVRCSRPFSIHRRLESHFAQVEREKHYP